MDHFAQDSTNKEKPLYCNVHPPQYLSIGEGEFQTGCAVIEVIFPNMTLVNIGEISLVNNYTAYLTLKAKIHKKTSSVQTKVSWKTGIKKFTMMPNPHCENGSQGYFKLSREHFCRNLTAVSALRFILYQPSPNWKTFSLEELYVYPVPNTDVDSNPVPRWLLRHDHDRELSDEANTVEQAKASGLPDPDEVSKHLHEMLRLTEKVENFRPSSDLGRFDIDDCYEINLLSYT